MPRGIVDDSGHRRYERQLLARGASLGFRLMEPPDAECYFCDRRGEIDSREHIIPARIGYGG